MVDDQSHHARATRGAGRMALECEKLGAGGDRKLTATCPMRGQLLRHVLLRQVSDRFHVDCPRPVVGGQPSQPREGEAVEGTSTTSNADRASRRCTSACHRGVGLVLALVAFGALGLGASGVASADQLYAFGDNYYGQLGSAVNNETHAANARTPALVSLPGAIGAITSPRALTSLSPSRRAASCMGSVRISPAS